jgi:hypothetical protein
MTPTPPVHILATCRNPELIRATTLVFDSLRVGFPTAHISVQINGELNSQHIHQKSIWDGKINSVKVIPQTTHARWIRETLEKSESSFWLCDTDMVFWSSMEDFSFDGHWLAGRYIPQFLDDFTKCITRPRLHTSLLYFDPVLIKAKLEEYQDQFPQTQFNPCMDLIAPQYGTVRDKQGETTNYFYDVVSGLYNAIGGTPFTEPQLNSYDHLNFGTFSDIVAPHYKGERWRETHFAIFENPELAKGIWQSQDEWYAKRAC